MNTYPRLASVQLPTEYHDISQCRGDKDCPICNPPIDTEALDRDLDEILNQESETSRALTAIGIIHEPF